MRERERREWVPLQADRIGHMRAPAHELFGFDFDLETQKMNLKKKRSNRDGERVNAPRKEIEVRPIR